MAASRRQFFLDSTAGRREVVRDMRPKEARAALQAAVEAARAAGALMRRNLHSPKKINATSRHDIKLELDVRCQKLIERRLRSAFPTIAVLGEEGVVGDPQATRRWVVDPIDGTVNFTYGIPHACVSIALQATVPGRVSGSPGGDAHETRVGVVYDPFCDELWTAIRGQAARLNGRVTRVSRRRRLEETILTLGFAKHRRSLEAMLPAFNRLVHRVRKIRIMGSAALALTYVASGRMDAYVESGIRLWDIAAGGLILECAGGDFWHEPVKGEYTYRTLANNGHLRTALRRLL
jgi:myo-inositol-1(or 4)-monophosphatase